ncbi:MAG TPA: phosphotransferase [Ignavibacteria bacterium]|nr:phosphotransferase [Ignavibacteria bacterium]
MSIRREIILNTFQELCFNNFGNGIDNISNLKADASERKIYRISSGNNTYIGIFNENPDENNAFINFSRSFRNSNFNVPEIYAVSEDKLFYIEEDLGNSTLFKHIISDESEDFMALYKRSLSDLIRFQITGKDIIDFNDCYQTEFFDESVIRSDLYKFNEFYTNIFLNNSLDGIIIEDIIRVSSGILSDADCSYFLYRDFQPRNIMLKNDDLYYIDYQSGRKGPLHYDLASFLYSGSIKITEDQRKILLDHYLDEIQIYVKTDKDKFITDFYFFVFLRLIQMLGSYAYLYKKRNDKGVLKKIAGALNNLKSIRGKLDVPELKIIIDTLTGFMN